MHPKIKSRPAGERSLAGPVQPLLLHEVANLAASVSATSRQRLVVSKSALGSASHARHHVSRRTQS
jgi:hypothetical protein